MYNFIFKCFILFAFTCLFYQVKSQTLIMNEVSNGPNNAKEYVEFVVVSNTVTYSCNNSAPPCIDIRGWIYDDNSGYHGTGAGVAQGAIRFSQNSLWSCIPLGTIILIYNAADRNPAIPPDDVSMSDGNCKIIAPVNGTLFDVNSTTPGAIACSYPSSGWTPATVSSWTSTALANTGDCSRMINIAGCEVFSVCYGNANLNTQIYFSGSGAQTVFYFNGTDPTNQVNWTSGDASISPGDQTPGVSNNAANAFYIGQFNNGCQPITPINVTATTVNAGCTCNGSATANATGSIAGYTYVWYDSGFNPIGQTGATANGLCTGVYNVIATSHIGCSDTTSVTISSSSTTSVTVNSQTVCPGGLALLTATPSTVGGTYSWSPGGQTTQTISVNPTSTTNYSVTYTLAGCNGTGTGAVTVIPIPTITVNSATICAGQTAALTASGAATYSWNTGSTNNPLTISPTSNTNYTVTGTIAGCTNTAIAIVSVNPLPTVTVNSATICTGQSATLTASGNPSYSWNTGETGNSITVTPSSTTNYTVMGTAAGCTNTAITTVSVNPLPNVIVNSGTICAGQTATLTATGATTFTWNTGATTSFITDNPITTTTYTVMGTTLGCSNTSTANITISSNLLLTINSPTICLGQTTTLTANGASSYAWNNGATGSSITVSPTSSATYTVNGSNGSCLGFTTTAVAVNPLPTITITSPTVCSGQAATLIASGATTYIWNTGSTSNPLIVSPTSNTHYTVTGTESGCSDTISYLLTVIPSPTLTVNSSTICLGQTTTLNVSGANSYVWDTGTTSNSFTIVPSSTTIYTVIGTLAGCSSTSTTNITVNMLPIITVASQTICEGQIATITANGATTYSWSNGSTANSLLVNPINSSTYTVTGTNFGCSSSASVAITVAASPNIIFNSNLTSGCAPLCIQFSDLTTILSGTISNWDWSFDDGTGSDLQNPNHCFNNSGLYDISLTATSSNGCSKTIANNDMINVFQVPTAEFTTNMDIADILDPTIQFINQSSNATIYNWNFGDLSSSNQSNPIHTYNQEGTYTATLIATNDKGCKHKAMHEIIINDIFTFYAPNTFTPNQDNINDIFLPIGVGWNPEKYQLNIFDRWGNNCFSTKDSNMGWDGKANNGTESAQIDTYTWKVELRDVNDKKHKFIGSITILR